MSCKHCIRICYCILIRDAFDIEYHVWCICFPSVYQLERTLITRVNNSALSERIYLMHSSQHNKLITQGPLKWVHHMENNCKQGKEIICLLCIILICFTFVDVPPNKILKWYIIILPWIAANSLPYMNIMQFSKLDVLKAHRQQKYCLTDNMFSHFTNKNLPFHVLNENSIMYVHIDYMQGIYLISNLTPCCRL